MEVRLGGITGGDYDYPIQAQNRAQSTEAPKQEQDNKALGQTATKTNEAGRNLENTTEEMTQWVQSLNTNIKFALHKETNELMVQVIDLRDQKVLKEFPPHEFLDTIAKIRDYVGILLDKKV